MVREKIGMDGAGAAGREREGRRGELAFTLMILWDPLQFSSSSFLSKINHL